MITHGYKHLRITRKYFLTLDEKSASLRNMSRLLLTLTATVVCTGCQFDFWDFGEEQYGPDTLYWCTADSRCLLAPPDDPRVLAAIADGHWQPHSLQTCPDPGPWWYTLTVVDPVVPQASRLRAAFCPSLDGETGGETLTAHTERFSICLPTQSAWAHDGAHGAIAELSTLQDPLCHDLEPYAFAHPYAYAMDCPFGAACSEFDTGCSCNCASGWDCTQRQKALEVEYFGGEYALSDAGWEYACTGYPIEAEPMAASGFVGTTCEWNQGEQL